VRTQLITQDPRNCPWPLLTFQRPVSSLPSDIVNWYWFFLVFYRTKNSRPIRILKKQSVWALADFEWRAAAAGQKLLHLLCARPTRLIFVVELPRFCECTCMDSLICTHCLYSISPIHSSCGQHLCMGSSNGVTSVGTFVHNTTALFQPCRRLGNALRDILCVGHYRFGRIASFSS